MKVLVLKLIEYQLELGIRKSSIFHCVNKTYRCSICVLLSIGNNHVFKFIHHSSEQFCAITHFNKDIFLSNRCNIMLEGRKNKRYLRKIQQNTMTDVTKAVQDHTLVYHGLVRDT